jgi:MFS family permease
LKTAEEHIQIIMADQMPPEAKRFKVSITSLFLYSIVAGVIGVVGGFLLLPVFHVHLDLLMFWRVTQNTILPILLLCVIMTLVLYVVAIPTGISSDGIYARSSSGFRRFIGWADIAKVKKRTIFNLRFLRLYSSVDGKVTSVPLFLACKNEFRDEIRKFAPPDSPILKFLN